MRKRQFYHSFIAALFLIILTATTAASAKTDTLKVNQVGKNNLVSINSKQMEDSCTELPGAPVRGEIRQEGENNRLEIRTSSKRQITNDKKQLTNTKQQIANDKATKSKSKAQKANSKNLNTNSKTQNTNNKAQITDDQSSGTSKNNISTTQTGNNNNVKINQQ